MTMGLYEQSEVKLQANMTVLRTEIFVTIIITILLFESHGLEEQNLLLCGRRSFRAYDPLIQECINGHVYKKSSISSTTSAQTRNSSTVLPDQSLLHNPFEATRNSSRDHTLAHISSAATRNSSRVLQTDKTPAITRKPDRLPRRTCRGSADLLDCNGIFYCGGTRGYRCCGFERYHPNNQTCCLETSARYKIHNKAEKNHMCCKLEAFGRGHYNSACPHPGANDRFFERPRKLTNDQKICQESNYVFRITITQHRRRRLKAKVGVWTWPPVRPRRKIRMKKRPPREVEMEIKIDKYSPKKSLSKKSFLVFSKHQYLNDAVLFLNPGDAIYRCPKRFRKMVQKLEKIYRKCI